MSCYGPKHEQLLLKQIEIHLLVHQMTVHLASAVRWGFCKAKSHNSSVKTNFSGNNDKYLKSLSVLLRYTEFTFKNRVGLGVSIDSSHLKGWFVAVMATFTSAVTKVSESCVWFTSPFSPCTFTVHRASLRTPFNTTCKNYWQFDLQNTVAGTLNLWKIASVRG